MLRVGTEDCPGLTIDCVTYEQRHIPMDPRVKERLLKQAKAEDTNIDEFIGRVFSVYLDSKGK